MITQNVKQTMASPANMARQLPRNTPRRIPKGRMLLV